MNAFLWERLTREDSLTIALQRYPGVLPALRRGANQEPGAAPELWPYYSRLNDQGYLTRELAAEHLCLVAFGIHQQGLTSFAHDPERPFGAALRRLRQEYGARTEALDRRVTQLATTQQRDEAAHHLYGLVRLMRGSGLALSFDYSQLFRDLSDLFHEQRAPRVRRRWGSAYFRPTTTAKEAS